VRISFVYSTSRTEVNVLRMLEGQRRSLVIMCPAGQMPVQTLLKVRDQLTQDELLEIVQVLGLDRPDGVA